ncbi:MAG: hypothetical protein LBS31_07300 [Candidatus Adiutrix sp.]|jgi:hypothetical protein|nr:hypothetical protein [Candidatus Adiutrix sp.]
MSEELEREIRSLLLQLVELNAALRERCPHHAAKLEEHENDINGAFKAIRKLTQDVTRLTVISALLMPVITAVLVKYFVK